MSRLNAHEIQIPYDNHHKVSSSVKSYQNTHNSVKSINNSRHWGENMLEYLFANIICSEKRTVFREHNSRKTVSFKEQDNVQGQISKHIFTPTGGYCVY